MSEEVEHLNPYLRLSLLFPKAVDKEKEISYLSYLVNALDDAYQAKHSARDFHLDNSTVILLKHFNLTL